MEDSAKYALLILLMLPFLALATDTSGRTQDGMIKVVVATSLISWLVVFASGDLGRRPNVAQLVMCAFQAWPVLLLIAKGFNPALSWISICLSVPVMSWHLVNLSLRFYPPDNGGGGFGVVFGWFAGWFFMIIPFTLLSGIFIAGRTVIRRVGDRTCGPPA